MRNGKFVDGDAGKDQFFHDVPGGQVGRKLDLVIVRFGLDAEFVGKFLCRVRSPFISFKMVKYFFGSVFLHTIILIYKEEKARVF